MHNHHENCFVVRCESLHFVPSHNHHEALNGPNRAVSSVQRHFPHWMVVCSPLECKGKRPTTKLIPTPAAIQECRDDPGKQEAGPVKATNHDLGQDQSQHLEESTGIAADVMVALPAIFKYRSPLGEKSKEILDFLRTAEMGEGCSREHAQGWLDYHHRKGGRSASVFPKDIRTLYEHLAKVCFIMGGV
jgi:hypothetical protein